MYLRMITTQCTHSPSERGEETKPCECGETEDGAAVLRGPR